MPLILRKGGVHEYYFQLEPPESIQAKLVERANISNPKSMEQTNDLFKYGCYKEADYKSGKSAAICDEGEFFKLTQLDFGQTGRCNFYWTTEQKFLFTFTTVGAFQVCPFVFQCCSFTMVMKFQKGSPYLEDANSLMQLSLEMGLKFTDYQRNIGHYHHNFTACDTWNKVKASHKNKDLVVLQYYDFYGLFILLGVGLGISSVTVIMEVTAHKMKNRI